MKTNPLVSIIVPIYNVEKYIHQCIESLLSQSLQNIEIILVDDGSPDNCPAICDVYALKDKRVKVIHKTNGGLSSARNAGIHLASGDYIGFVDSDDYVDSNMFEQMSKSAEDNNVDFVMCDYLRVNDQNTFKKTLDIREGYYDKNSIRKEIFPILIMRENIDYGPLLSVWHCLYSTTFIKDNTLFFDAEIKYSEDCIFSAMVGYKADSFYYMKDSFYYRYRYNPISITTTYKKDAWNVYCAMNKKIISFFENCKDYDFTRQNQLHIIYFAFSAIGQLKFSNLNYWNKYREYKLIINTEELRRGLKQFKLPDVNIKLKLNLLLLKYKLSLLLLLLIKNL